MLLNCGVGEDSWESLDCKEIQPVHPKGNQFWIFMKDWCWSWNSNTLATWREELTQWRKTLMLGKTEGRRRRGWQRTGDVSLSKKLRMLGIEAWCAAVHGLTKSQPRLSDWTDWLTYPLKKKGENLPLWKHGWTLRALCKVIQTEKDKYCMPSLMDGI